MKIRTRISSDQLNINRRGQYRFILAERSCEHLLKFWATEQETLSLFLLSTRNRRDSFSIITSVAILLPTSEENGPFLAPRCENKLQHDAQLTRLKVKASLRARDVLTVRKSICIRGEEVTTHENKNGGQKLSGDLIMFYHFQHLAFILYNTRRDHLRKVEAMFGNVGYVYVVCWTDLRNFTVSLQMLSKCNDSVSVDSSVSSVNAAPSRLFHPNTNAHTHTSSGPFIRLDSERGPEPWGLTLNLTVTLQILSWRRRVLHLLLSFKTLNSLSPWNVRPIKKSQGFEFFFLLR